MVKIKETDVLVIGGGINGAGIARDLAGRGLTVVLCEKDDLASATSSKSSKMIHGGLRYLEYYEFRLVREALKERDVLLRSAPHLVQPMSFVLPHYKKLRPWWMIRMGLFMYDLLAGWRKLLPSSYGEVLTGTLMGEPLKRDFERGFVYSDCWVDDARMVALNAKGASEKGADILTRTECTDLYKHPDQPRWIASLDNRVTGEKLKVHARLVINASGPWVNQTLNLVAPDAIQHKVRWVRGSHIVVPKLYQGDHAYLLQNDDRRVVFLWPYEKKYTLIGTTEADFNGNLDKPETADAEKEYLCAAVGKFFRHAPQVSDIVWDYSGVRPLVDDGNASASAVTREYIIENRVIKDLPMINVYGGKLTTFRPLSEHVADTAVKVLGKGGKRWTHKAHLPGGEGVGTSFTNFLSIIKREYNWMPEPLLQRYARAYGSRLRQLIGNAKRISDLGAHFGDQVYEAEIRYLCEQEWAMTADDILWRRSKLGLHISPETRAQIETYLAAR